MARFTDIIFREFCKQQGADVMVTEFVQADALTREDPKLWETVDFTEAQRPMGVQIFGSNPESMAAAARMLTERLRPDFIDINLISFITIYKNGLCSTCYYCTSCCVKRITNCYYFIAFF